MNTQEFGVNTREISAPKDMSGATTLSADSARWDRWGAIASGACAVHCALTPFILLLVPVLGSAWASPVVHWVIAAVALPLAALVLFRGYRKHRQRWIAACAILGMTAVIIGLVLPGLPGSGGSPAAAAPHATEAACADHCCPTLHIQDDGATTVAVPPASVATFIGGIFLVLAHIGNLRRCRRCG